MNQDPPSTRRAALTPWNEFQLEAMRRGICFVQGDQSIANQAGAAFRADLNNELQALVTKSSGTSAPSPTWIHQWWADTTSNTLKKRNAANSGWIVICTLDETFVLSRASNTILGLSDIGKAIRATAGYTQTFAAVATLTDKWCVAYRIESGATIIFDPNAAENIDGAATKTIAGPASGFIYCDGNALYTVGFIPLASQITNSLGADVLLNNTANYFDGPSVAQGTAGTWFASGNVTITDTGSACNADIKLWDGTTIIASARVNIATGLLGCVSLSGYLTSPAGNIRISAKDFGATTGKIIFNATGNSKDSTITATRIA
jgi:hypothetical protein